MDTINVVGRRKTAVARVYLTRGKGDVVINHRSLIAYFPTEEISQIVMQPLEKLKLMDQFDLKLNVYGGGLRGKVEAIRLGIARALVV